MKHLIVPILVAVAVAHAQGESTAPKMYVIPSWGDLTLVYGPGTDPAMDTAAAMENMVKHWKGRGFTGVYLRTDLDQFPPGSVIRHDRNTQPQPTLAVAWHLIDEVMEKCDPHEAARRAAEKHGFEYWMWHPHIYSEGAPVDAGVPGEGRMVPWSYMLRYYHEHPETITVDREGNKQWMVPEYAYPGARADKAAEVAYLAETYRPTGIVLSMRSETSQLIPPPEHADQFGFNQIVVDKMKKLYNVDILTDQRFDWKSPDYKSDDPMVQNWRNLRGSHITQLYRDIRRAMRRAAPEVQLAIVLSGEYVGPLMGNAKLEWRKWIDEGIVDVIVMPVTFEATLDLQAHTKGYLTDVRAGKGLVTTDEVKQYILASQHPNIQVIHTGAPSYFYPPPPKGADGWQCDIWYDAYHLAWYQRWEQWRGDLADFGFIKFIEQTFDEFKPNDPGVGGGIGDGRYNPTRRACPGVWYTIGDGSSELPYVQQDVRRGSSGAAMALSGKDLIGLHHSSPDRSLLTGQMDTAIVNGKAELSCWVYRETDESSLTVYFSGNANYEKDVALRIQPKSGHVFYANGSSWVQSNVVVPVKEWFPVLIKVDVDALTYSAYAGEDKAQVCTGISFARPEERFVTQHGVNVPIKVPSYRLFNALIFSPQGGPKDLVYVDDVLVKWMPALHYAPHGQRKFLDEQFEGAKAGSTEFSGPNPFRVVKEQSAAEPFVIEKTTSFGPGVHCVRATGGGSLTAELRELTPSSSRGAITIDLDFFIRSDKDFPYILPDPTTRSPHSVVFALNATPDQPYVAVDSSQGTWRLWDGHEFVDTKKQVTYDVWNHLQIVVDPRSKRYRLIVQPVGEMPTVIGEAACGAGVRADARLTLSISPSATEGHVSCYDNILVTAN